jgi:lipoate-protein ligase A
MLGRVVNWDDAAAAFRIGFETELGVRFEDLPLSESEQSRALELVREKYAHPSWTERV